ncbi:T9SS type A sorting domain-containing protein [Pollutibacter soli]|uniref:T9SS type A sorting domain-containing protein n=1 Tax=Pollutibacter soli TaxID=3034157 RepID=UPI0030136815
MKTFYFFVLLVFTALSVHAQSTLNSAASGNWADPMSWDQQRLPNEGDVIVVLAGHNIILDQNISLNNVTLRVMGTLEVGPQKKLELDAGSVINILTGGVIVSTDQSSLSFISLGNVVKYRGSKVFNTGWSSGVVKGMAYATTTSGDIDAAGQGFILGKLPAVWQDFNLVRTPENYIQMVWVTSHETGTLTFEIQKSYDVNTWSTIGTMKSVGNISSPQNIYSFIDNQPGSGMVYYRVKHRYPDGKIVFSAVRLIKIEKTENSFTVYPNPAHNEAKVLLSKTSEKGSSLCIFSMNGQAVRKLSVPKGIQLIPVDLSGLSSGMYLLQMTTPGGEQQLMRLVKN